jgi:short-subunit dehydrogenase
MRVTQAFLSHFREKRKGMFINTTSIGGTITLPFNSVYHATKFALEGWSESLSFELEPYGIRVKTIAPGSILTDFSGRSLDIAQHKEYEELFNKYYGVIRNPERRNSYSSPEQIAEIVYEAATDGKSQIKYIAGEDAKGYFQMRESLGQEGFRKEAKKLFFG